MNPEQSHNQERSTPRALYGLEAKTVVESIKENPEDAVDMTASLLRNIQGAVIEGKLVSKSTGDIYTEDQVFDQQLPAFFDELSKGELDMKDVPVALRPAFGAFINDGTSREALQRAFDVVQQERSERKLAEAKRLEKEAQVKAFAPRQQLGGHALKTVFGSGLQPSAQPLITSDMIPKANVVENVQQQPVESQQEAPKTKEQVMGELTESFSIDDMQLLREYSDAMEDKRRAQKAGNGKDSEYFGQVVGQAYRQMSPQVRAVAAQYERVYNS